MFETNIRNNTVLIIQLYMFNETESNKVILYRCNWVEQDSNQRKRS